MSSDKAVINASPLITLCKSGQEWLLPQLFSEVVIPSAVWEEVAVGAAQDLAAQKLASFTWANRDDSIIISPIIQAWDLGAGESAVLSCGLAQPELVAVLDDAAARRCASTLSLKFVGTIGLIVLAKRRGLVAQIAPGLQALLDAGLWLSDKLIEQLKRQEGE